MNLNASENSRFFEFLVSSKYPKVKLRKLNNEASKLTVKLPTLPYEEWKIKLETAEEDSDMIEIKEEPLQDYEKEEMESEMEKGENNMDDCVNVKEEFLNEQEGKEWKSEMEKGENNMDDCVNVKEEFLDEQEGKIADITSSKSEALQKNSKMSSEYKHLPSLMTYVTKPEKDSIQTDTREKPFKCSLCSFSSA